MPNPFDVGSAKMLAHAGFEALATTSAGFAWSLGVDDGDVTFDQLRRPRRARSPPPSTCRSTSTASGCSPTISTAWRPTSAGCTRPAPPAARSRTGTAPAGAIDPVDLAAERVAAAAEAAHVAGDPLVLTARCENLLHGVPDLDDTIARLCAYRDAGADCVYAPGLTDGEQIKRRRRRRRRPGQRAGVADRSVRRRDRRGRWPARVDRELARAAPPTGR